MRQARGHIVILVSTLSLCSTLCLCSTGLAQYRGAAARTPARSPSQAARPAPAKASRSGTTKSPQARTIPTRASPPQSRRAQEPTTGTPPSSLRPPAGTRVKPVPLTPEERDARTFQQLRLQGKELSRAIAKLIYKLKWHKSLNSAQKAAVKLGKPILWIQALGKLTGYT